MERIYTCKRDEHSSWQSLVKASCSQSICLGIFRPCRLLIDVNEKQQREEKMRTKMSLLRMQNIFGLPAAHVQMPKQKGPQREKGKITACHIKVAI